MRAKKSLGQNFLKSKEALRLIIEAGDIQPTDTILEIGPGYGFLTEELLSKANTVIAVEKDEMLAEGLKETFAQEIADGKLNLIVGDILEFNPEGDYKLVANIPYYITGMVLRKFLETSVQPERIVLLLQKEVAQRIVARDKKESILSLSVKAYGEPKYIKTIQAKYFSPVPNVDSAILLIKNISKDFFIKNNIDEQKFFELIKAGFAHKRKMLKGNLKGLFKNPEKILEKVNIPLNARAEDIALEHWRNIAQKID